MSAYSSIISAATGETDPRVLGDLETIMRQDIFGSTLDWQTREQLTAAAKEALVIRAELIRRYGRAS